MPQSSYASPATASWLARAGAIAYGIWALLHFQAAWSVYQLGQSMPEGMERGRVLQDAWNLLWFSIIAILAAVGLNWRNDVRGWWINLAAVSVADLGFIFFVLMPGHVPMWPGLAGPIFWILGLGFSTVALFRQRS
ncbi:hypothetical protein M0208_05055 [Sphingomonas sp. SUN019]|uniref:hypothetical protein n=1 Tax=Sphingomonas sp. SUN019 TaxID=2937788 RepID=UPI0021642C39|nr:hypothetical protein [Sphingomonas sp. SUN019]UVO49916.1 hypothetical protein M0208_05055 [Sphingomonas sp. SUN019]